MSQSLTSLFASILALALVLALAWILIKAMAMLNKTTKRRGLLTVVDTLPIGNRERVILVSYANRHYLLGATANGITLIDKNDSDSAEGQYLSDNNEPFQRKITNR